MSGQGLDERDDAPLSGGVEIAPHRTRGFGTFSGVFRPTILTILGVMMYLREGWLVGHAGIAGAILVIVCCFLITGATALSLSSITTNIRVSSGGVFSIISQSLGLEVGGSIGIPFFLAQGLSAAMYLYGFYEGWSYAFPNHPPAAILSLAFLAAVGLSYISAGLAFRIQIVILIAVSVALASMFTGLGVHPHNPEPLLWGEFDVSFRDLFAVFFPASTGIMVGASMSGSLADARRSIPRGTMAAWAIALVVYCALAVWYGNIATSQELIDLDGGLIAADRSYYQKAVLVGIILSCFCAALSSLVAAPRVLQALAANQIIPCHASLAKLVKGEPRNATLATALLVGLALIFGDLNGIATVLTMFFLMAYFSINTVLLLEQQLQLISFRPEFRVHTAVPVIGAASSLMAMVAINPLVGLLALSVSVGIYVYLDRRKLSTPWETVHSGLFFSIANWAAKRASTVDQKGLERAWRPNFLIPIEREAQFEGNFRFIRDLTFSQGAVHVLGIRTPGSQATFHGLRDLVHAMQKEDKLFATHAVTESSSFCAAVRDSAALLSGTFFRPNLIFTSIESRSDEDIQAIMHVAREHQMGVLLLAAHPVAGLGRERTVNLWVRDQSPDWQLGLKLANLDCAVLMSYQLQKNWQGTVRLLTVVREANHLELARTFLTDLLRLARMSKNVAIDVRHGSFATALQDAPRADLHIFGLASETTVTSMRTLVQSVEGSCLFVLDSGSESALA